MKPRSRKAFAIVALVAGVVLVFFEVRRDFTLGRVESWFWLLVGVLVIVFASAEFVTGPNDGADSNGTDPRP